MVRIARRANRFKRPAFMIPILLILGTIGAATSTAIIYNEPAYAGTFPGENGRIVFASDRDAEIPTSDVPLNWEIYTMDPDGSDVVRLTNNDAQDLRPSLSAEGEKIAFDSAELAGGDSEIFVMDADGSNLKQLTDNDVQDTSPSWSPDAERIAFTSGSGNDAEIYTMDAYDGSDFEQLTDNDAADHAPIWSPNGERIAFDSTRDGVAGDIYTMDAADGSDVVRLTDNDPQDDEDSVGSWSPDGEKIAFISNAIDNFFDIFVMDAYDGSNVIQVTGGDDVFYEFPKWSPDGEKIAFESNRGTEGNLQIFIMDADGSDLVRITEHDRADHTLDWGVKAELDDGDGNEKAREIIQDLIDEIKELDLPEGVESSLLGPLHQAAEHLEDDNEANDLDVCKEKLESFIEIVEAREQQDRISEEDADILRGLAEDVKDVLGCI